MTNDKVPATEVTSLLDDAHHPRNPVAARLTLLNFILFAIFSSTTVCCVIACIALATSRLGSVGAWQSGILYLFYTGSALSGATYIVKGVGARNALMTGLALYCVYILCYLFAILSAESSRITAFALLGAIFGGIGGGIFWTAHGTYFTQAAEEHALYLGTDWATSTSLFAGIFAFIFLMEEAALNLLSTVLVERVDDSWPCIFGMYASIAILSTCGLSCIKEYPLSRDRRGAWYKMATALYLFVEDPKMKYFVGLNAAFGLAGSFLNSFVSGQVVRVVLNDDESRYVGGLTALTAAVAASCSLIFGQVLVVQVGKGPILVAGALAFAGVALPFIFQPNLEEWTWGSLLWVYVLQGVGRATFESTLKSVFADYFAYEKEGAFANIILQNGLFTSLGFILSFRMSCSHPSMYCMEFSDGSLHHIIYLEVAIVFTSMVAILGYWRASVLHATEKRAKEPTKLGSYRRDSLSLYRSLCSRVSGHMDDATFAMFEQFDLDT